MDNKEKKQENPFFKISKSVVNWIMTFIYEVLGEGWGYTFFPNFLRSRILNLEIAEKGISSSFAQQLLNKGHDCDISNLYVLHIEQKGYRLDSLEI